MFRALVLIIRRSKLHYTASGIITLKQASGLKLLKYNSINEQIVVKFMCEFFGCDYCVLLTVNMLCHVEVMFIQLLNLLERYYVYLHLFWRWAHVLETCRGMKCTYCKTKILCIKLVNYWDKYTEMHGQQNIKKYLFWDPRKTHKCIVDGTQNFYVEAGVT